VRYCLSICLVLLPLAAAEHHGRVQFGALPVPGAVVTADRGGNKLTAVTDQNGSYSFADLADGPWTIQVEMLCFSTIQREVTVAVDAAASDWELKLMPLEEIKAAASRVEAAPAPPAPERRVETRAAEVTEDSFLINGSVNNGASSPFSISPAFGNFRKGARPLYNGSLGFTVDNSALDARSFSLTGQDTPKPAYSHIMGMASLGGPLRIPHLLRNGPNVFVGYQWVRNRNASVQSGLMPTLAERNGDLSQGQIPQSRISPQARTLLRFYPLPNFDGGARYNYQTALVGATHQDNLQSRANKSIGKHDQISGTFSYQSTRNDDPNLFGFLDTGDVRGINATVNWRHSFSPTLHLTLGYQFSRLSMRTTPYFANRENVSGEAGISGNNQEPLNWGPPSLNFAGGIAGLSDARQSLTHNQTSGVSLGMMSNRGRHNLSFGGDYRRQQFNDLSQQDARGTFTFTGAAAGSDFAGFLLGIPDTSSIAFGNADKYFRSSTYDAYLNDDWRITAGFTLNAGVRWEYSQPINELYGRLVNLDIAPGFGAAVPVVARDAGGDLVHPDKHGLAPRVGFSWRPFAASSMVVRGGYGVYYNTSVYQPIATQMAQQSPLSKSLSVQNTPEHPLTLANGFNVSPATTPNTFAVDPSFRVGYSQNWQLSVQRDLPAAMMMTATYVGIKGTRGMQQFLPNTFPVGALDPCPSCPRGFAYLTSNGNSTRESGAIQLRRRMHNGFTWNLQYTFSKSIDDAALGGRNQGGPLIAQNWLNLAAERGLSNFDQRHMVVAQAQYTTGMGMGGGTLLGGWRGGLLKEWTIASQVTAGSGLPLTPIYLAAVRGTGVTGSIRPDYTGASVYAAPAGLFLNPAAYAAPAAGQWGNAGRNSITGPSQLAVISSMGRTFRWGDRMNVDLRIDATNPLNHVTFPNYNTTVTSSQFGLPNSANAMRNVQTTMRVRF
jgi:hypothetical protein